MFLFLGGIMDAKEFLVQLGLTEEQIQKKIQHRIADVGGLLSEEAAMMLLAGEKGWKPEDTCALSDLSDEGLDALFATGNITTENTSYFRGPMVVRIQKIYDAEKPKNNKFVEKRTRVKVSDGFFERYLNFDDKQRIERKDPNTGETKIIPANHLATAMQMVRKDAIGSTIAIEELQMYKYNKGYIISTTNYTKFKVVDAHDEEICMAEVDMSEVEEELR